MIRALKIVSVLIVAALGIVTASAAAWSAAQSSTAVTIVPIELESLSCGPDAELVTLSGNVRLVSHFTETRTGRVVSSQQAFAQNVTGTGESGTLYRLQYVNTYVSTSSTSSPVFTQSYTLQFTLRGPGPGNDAVFRTVVHSTVNAAGELVVDFSKNTQTCQ